MSEQESTGVGIIIATFSSETGAKETLKAMQKAKVNEKIYYEDASIVKKEADGSIHVKETEDTSAGKGAGIGAIIGGVIGLIGGPAGVVIAAGTGAAIGGLLAKGDAGFRDKSLEKVGEELEPGTSAIVAITSQAYLEGARDYISGFNAKVTTHELDEAMAAKWRVGEDVTPGVDLTDLE